MQPFSRVFPRVRKSAYICPTLNHHYFSAPEFRGRVTFILCLALCLVCSSASSLHAQSAVVDSPAWRYGDSHAGANTQETTLTPANVSAGSFGKLFSVAVDGYVYAQPLYMHALRMPDGAVHNVVFVATEHDSVYAFDADGNSGESAQPLWQASMVGAAHGAAAGATSVPNGDVASNDIVPEVGINATPVINPATGTLYVVAKSKENGTYVQRLHALDILTGAEKPGSPVVITATIKGTGTGSSGGTLSFSSLWQNSRPALSFFNGHVYAAFGAHSDNGPWHGWVLAYDGTTLAQTAALCLSPSGTGSGIWGGGAALPIDPSGTGSMFLSTGNGDYANYSPVSSTTDFGDSIVKVDLANGGLTAVDVFTPSNQAALSGQDRDQGSGGVLMLPDQQGSHPHLVIQAGKSGAAMVLDRDGLGGYDPSSTYNTNAVQEIYNAVTGLWSTPAFWNGYVYFWGSNDYLKAYSLNSGLLSSKQVASGSVHSGFPGASPTVSADGNQNGIVWAVNSELYASNGSEILYAYDATDVKTILFRSSTLARDDAGRANKFSIPVVANGKVYVSAAYQVDVYGLLNGATETSAPAITPNGGAFSSAPQAVSIASSTADAAIFYTMDGSTPTTGSTPYSAPFNVSSNTVVKAIASAPGYLESSVSSAAFNFSGQTAAPTISPASGSYSSAQSATIADTISGAVIYYTLDGSSPTQASSVYKGPVNVAASLTLKAIAVGPPLAASAVTSSTYQIQSANSVISFPNGFSNTSGLTLNGSAVATDDSRLQLTTDLSNQAGSFFYNTPVNIQNFTTDFSFQLSSAQGDGFTFTIQNAGVNALGGAGSVLGYAAGSGRAAIGKSIAIKFDFHNNAGEGNDSTGLYTNGASPTIPAVNIAPSGIQLNSGDSMLARLEYDGSTLSLRITDGVTGKIFTTSFSVNVSSIVGSSNAFVGFTAGTGGASASQKILNWTFTPSSSQSTPAVNYPTGFTQPSVLSLNGTSQIVSSTLQLTTASTHGAAASAWFNTPLNIGAFTTDFDFQLQQAVADGFTFTIQNTGLKALGRSGGSLGFGPTVNGGTDGIQKSVAVKLDIHSNAGEGNNSTGLYVNGATPTLPAVSIASGVTLANGDPIHAHLVYDGKTLQMTLTDTKTQAAFNTAFTVDIPSIVGASTAYAGFTGGTGGSTVNTLITGWTFGSN